MQSVSKAAWDETVVIKAAWDETVTTKAAWTETKEFISYLQDEENEAEYYALERAGWKFTIKAEYWFMDGARFWGLGMPSI